MKHLIAAICWLCLLAACRNGEKPSEFDSTALPEAEHNFEMDTVKGVVYGSFTFDSVVAFEIPIEHEIYSIVKDSLIKPNAYIKREKLNAEQADKLHSVLNDTAMYGTMPASCFEPHLVLAYFKTGKVVAEISICFRCNTLFANPRIAASYYHQSLSIIDNDTFQIVRNGFSDVGREQLGNLCNEFNFSHCKQK